MVGTYGWVDPNGYLRLRDYIADNAGYRILKSRMLFVGDGADVGNAVVAAKNVPATGGELASPNSSPFNTYSVTPNRAIYVPPLPANQNLYNRPSETRIYVPNLPENGQGTTPASTFRLLQNLGPQYFHSSTPSPVRYYTPSPTPAAYTASTPQTVHIYPSASPSPQYYSSSPSPQYYTSTPSPIHYYSSSTPTTNHYVSSTPAPTHYYQSTTASPVHYYPSSTPSAVHYYPSSTPVVDIHHNADPKYNGLVYASSTAAPSTTSRPIAVYSQTPRPVAVNYVSSPPESVTPSPLLPAIGYTASTPSPIDRPAPIAGRFASPNNFITETEKNKLFYQHEQNRGYYKKRFVDYKQPAAQEYKRFVDYKPNEQEYDGISTVQNGFR